MKPDFRLMSDLSLKPFLPLNQWSRWLGWKSYVWKPYFMYFSEETQVRINSWQCVQGLPWIANYTCYKRADWSILCNLVILGQKNKSWIFLPGSIFSSKVWHSNYQEMIMSVAFMVGHLNLKLVRSKPTSLVNVLWS